MLAERTEPDRGRSEAGRRGPGRGPAGAGAVPGSSSPRPGTRPRGCARKPRSRGPRSSPRCARRPRPRRGGITEAAHAQIDADRQQALIALRTEVGRHGRRTGQPDRGRVAGPTRRGRAGWSTGSWPSWSSGRDRRRAEPRDAGCEQGLPCRAEGTAARGPDPGRPPAERQRPRSGCVQPATPGRAAAALRAQPRDRGRAEAVGDELFSVLPCWTASTALRRALADPHAAGRRKGAGRGACCTARSARRPKRWSRPRSGPAGPAPADLADALEQLAVEAFAFAAEDRGQLDDLEDDLFRFGRVVATQPELRAALSESVVSPEHKQQLIDTLLGGKVSAGGAAADLRDVAAPTGPSPGDQPGHVHPDRGRAPAPPDRRGAVATAPTAQQRQRLAAGAGAASTVMRCTSTSSRSPVIGGMTIQVGDELIDGSVATRLAVRRAGRLSDSG